MDFKFGQVVWVKEGGKFKKGVITQVDETDDSVFVVFENSEEGDCCWCDFSDIHTTEPKAEESKTGEKAEVISGWVVINAKGHICNFASTQEKRDKMAAGVEFGNLLLETSSKNPMFSLVLSEENRKSITDFPRKIVRAEVRLLENE